MKKKLISFVIPVYNAEFSIQTLIDEIEKINYCEFEVILINDGSTDNSLEIMHKISNTYENIKVLSQINKGVSSARNNGLTIAEGDFIMFVDADDLIDADQFIKIVDRVKHGKIDILIFGLVDRFYKNNQIIKEIKGFSMCKQFDKSEFCRNFGFLLNQLILYSPCNKIYRRDLLLKNNLNFDIKYRIGEDICFNIQCFSRAETFEFSNDYAYIYNHHFENTETGSTKFFDNEIDINVSIFDMMNGFLKENDEYSSNKNEIDKFIIRRLSGWINGVCSKSSPLTMSERILFIKNLYNYRFIDVALNNKQVKMNCRKDKILYFLYKHKCNYITYSLFYMKNR